MQKTYHFSSEALYQRYRGETSEVELRTDADPGQLVYSADRERRIVYWNESAERISGKSREEMVGKYCFESGLDHIDLEEHQLCTSL